MVNIPGFTIGRVLGEGGMSTVYLAEQVSLGRQVALKIMSPALVAADSDFCQRFVNEGRIIAKLRHQHIVTIHDIGCANEQDYFMAMEYCLGGTLKERILDGSSPDQAMSVLRQVASALGYAHEHGFIHRDIKPGNVLFRDDGTAVLSDFGIAKTLNARTRVTREGWAIGTPEYMSPEQAAGADLAPSADLYSLGVMFYEMLTGQKPFRGSDALATAMKHANAPIPCLPSDYISFQHLLDGLLAKRPAERFESAGMLIAEIDAIERGRPRPLDEDATRFLDPAVIAPAGSEPRASARRPMSLGARLLAWTAVLVIVAIGGFWTARLGQSIPDDDGTGRTVDSPTIGEQSAGRREPVSAELPPAQAERVTRLLEIAQIHLSVGRQCEPPGSNAYEAYALITEIDPGNAEASAALQRLEAACEAD